MKSVSGSLILLAAVLSGPAAVRAHFNVLLPARYEQWRASRGQEVPLRLLWGHGYEHAWLDARRPAELVAISPTGKVTNLIDAIKPATVRSADGKERSAFGFTYRPAERGDHILAMRAALLWDEEEEVFLQDYAKSVLHVQDKVGWDRRVGHPLELVPLNRPYGLLPGQIVRMLVLRDGKPLPGCAVEIEKLSATPPAESELPGEEFITFEAVSDSVGVVVFGMHDEGWFALTATHPTDRQVEHDGHKGRLVERATFWIHVVGASGAK